MTDDGGKPGRASARETPDTPSSGLLERIKANDGAAWARFVDLYGPLIYGWCRQCGLKPEDAADVVQETFGAAAAGIARFRRQGPGDTLRGWLWTIARNKVRDHARRRAGHATAEGGSDAQQRLAQVPERPLDDSHDGLATTARDTLERRAIELVRATVEPRTWQAFWSLTVDDRPVADVAEELGMSVRAVYEAKYRVRRRIRQQWADLLD